MARGRMISQSVREDIEFHAMSMEARLLYLMTIPHLDRDGLINGHPAILHGTVAPLMRDMAEKMQVIIEEWIQVELVVTYTVKSTPILFFTGFSKNQIGMRYERESPSTFPPPPGWKRTAAGLIKIEAPGESEPSQDETPQESQPADDSRKESGKTPAEVRQNSGGSPPEVEVKDQEEGEDRHAPARENTQSDGVVKDAEPSASSPHVDGLALLMARGTERFERNRRNGGVRSVGWQTELNKELAPALRTPLAESLAQACGLTAAMEDDAILQDLHEFAVKFHKASFSTPEKIQRLKTQWLADPWRKDKHPMPSLIAFFKFASQAAELAKPPEQAQPARPAPQTVRIYNQYSGQYEDRIVA